MDSGLNGPFPVFKSKSLDFLNIAGNSFNGGLPNDIGTRYPALITLNIANNTFVGTLPKTITSLTNLDTLNVAHNQLMGTIPDDLGKLVHLKGLFMNDNRFIGTIPRSLAHLESKLIQIFVQHNSLSGTIPANLAELPQLIDFFVDGTLLTELMVDGVVERICSSAIFSLTRKVPSRKQAYWNCPHGTL
jgi:Leucine-rich repeat (LRR) protein